MPETRSNPTSSAPISGWLHPASRILIYLLAALAIPGLPFIVLPMLCVLALTLLIGGKQAPFRLIWRTRWLLLVLMFGYAYSIPGESVWIELGAAAPSQEGLRHGLEQASRLLVLLLWLDLLVLRLSSEALLSGLYQLLRPLVRLGADPGRIALRLGLTLRAIEGLERGRGNLRALLAADFTPALPDGIRIGLVPLRILDWLLPALLGALLVVYGLHTS